MLVVRLRGPATALAEALAAVPKGESALRCLAVPPGRRRVSREHLQPIKRREYPRFYYKLGATLNRWHDPSLSAARLGVCAVVTKAVPAGRLGEQLDSLPTPRALKRAKGRQ